MISYCFWPEYGDAAKHSAGFALATSLFFGRMAVSGQNMGMLRNIPQASPPQHPSFSAIWQFLARIWGCCETLRRLRPCSIPLFRPHSRFWPEYGDTAKHSAGFALAASLFFGRMAVPSQNMGMLRNTPQAAPLQHPSFSAVWQFLARIWGYCETLRRLHPRSIPLFRPYGSS